MRPTTAIEGLFLVISNIALLPAIIYAFYLKLIPETSIISVVFIISTVYHLCQAGFICLLTIDFVTFQFSDHFFVYSLLVWIVLYAIGLPLEFRFAIFIWIQALLFPLLLEFKNTWWFGGFIIGFIVLITVLLLSLIIRAIPRINIFSLIAAVILLGIGFALHLIGGDPTPPSHDQQHLKNEEDDINHKYVWLHSLWHIFSMLAIYYVLDLKYGKSLFAQAISKFFHKLFHPYSNQNQKQKKIKKTNRFISGSKIKKLRNPQTQKKVKMNKSMLSLGTKTLEFDVQVMFV